MNTLITHLNVRKLRRRYGTVLLLFFLLMCGTNLCAITGLYVMPMPLTGTSGSDNMFFTPVNTANPCVFSSVNLGNHRLLFYNSYVDSEKNQNILNNGVRSPKTDVFNNHVIIKLKY